MSESSEKKKPQDTTSGDDKGSEDKEDKNPAGDSAAGKAEDKSVGFLREYLAHSLGLREKIESKLEEMTLAGMAKYLASDECKNVVTMAGAGISTSAGIPDFRSPGSGLYDNLASYDLPHPQAIFDIDFFKENPKPFFVLAKELYPGSFKPTVCHYFIKMLRDKGKLLRHYTQNIDTLERVAGMDADSVVEAHGTFYTSHCLKCNKEFTLDWMKEQIFSDKVPKCIKDDCEGVVKPDIVFFGETLPSRFAGLVEEDFSKCDLLIVMGTSLTVQPFASLVSRVSMETPRLYINLEKGMSCNNPITALFFGGGFNFDGDDNYRDVFKEATCDDGCQELAELLGWGEELKDLVKAGNAEIDKKAGKQSSPKGKETPSEAHGKKPDSDAKRVQGTSATQGAAKGPSSKTKSLGATPKAKAEPAKTNKDKKGKM